MKEVKTVRGAETVHFDPWEKETQIPKVDKKMRERDFTNVPKKKSVFVLWLLSLITLGIYPTIWYLNRSKEFYNLGTQKKLSHTLPMIFLILTIIYIGVIITFPLTITEEMGTFYQHPTSLQYALIIALVASVFLSLLFSLILAFISRGIINEAILENKGISVRISWFFTLIFTVFYLQYEINRIIDDKEDKPRKGPWIVLIILLVLIGLAIAAPFVGLDFLGI